MSALFHHIESLACYFPPQTVQMEYTTPEGRCLIDADTVTYLELLAPIKNSNTHATASLFGLLNQSKTVSVIG